MSVRRLIVVALFMIPASAAAQARSGDTGPWSLRVRVALSGSSYESEPAGYTIYSGVGIEAGLLRRLSAVTAVTWEESGELDTAHPQPTVGPAAQLGADFALDRGAVFNLDVRWHAATVDIEHFGLAPPSVRIDPLTLAAGLGIRF